MRSMKPIRILAILILSLCAFPVARASDTPPATPNIVYILADDLGYGDVHCLNPQRGKIATPSIDRLATQGMSFTDAHSSSSVCTPTRYGILTGRYAWRTRLQGGVLFGLSKPLIAPDRFTVGKLLQQHGYHTACLGKWHLGMDWPGGATDNPGANGVTVDYSLPIRNGPTTCGFDYFFGITGSLDIPPFIWIENDRTLGAATTRKKLVREGPAAPDFEAAEVLPTLVSKAREYIVQRAAEKKPFFLYLPFNSPHAPIVPTRAWQCKSGLGDYGDFVMETDWAVGEVLAALEKNGLADNTLVIFASDNGCSPVAGIPKLESQGHYPSAQFRGYKADIFDGGHRIPFIARWPGRIKAGTQSDQLICLNDLMATCAEILGDKLRDNAGEDSVSILPALLGTADKPLREAVVHHSINGSFAIRQGQWKLELCPDSGGWGEPRPGGKDAQGLPPIQLYDMTQDVGERANVSKEHPEVVARLSALLEKYVTDGRSTPGAPQQNDISVNIHRTRGQGKEGK